MIHSFLLFFFICNYVESIRMRSATPATTGPDILPQYAQNSVPWPAAEYAASNKGPQITSEAIKSMPITTTLELRDSYQKPYYRTQVFDVPSQPGPATGLPPAAVLEGAALAQAMSGLWDVEPKSPHQTRWSGSDEKTLNGNTVQSIGRYI